MIRVPRKRVAGTAAAVLVAGALVGATSTPTMAMGEESTYVVLAPQGQSTAKAADRVAAAGGTVVASYDKIGVLVARSSSTRLRRRGRRRPASSRSPRPTGWAPPSTRAPRRLAGRPGRDRRPHRRAAVGPAVGHGARSTSPRPTPSRRVTRRSSSASSTAGSPAPTRTSRPRSPRTRAPRASAASSTRPRPRGTPRPPTTAPTSPAPSPPRSTASASRVSRPASRSPR